MLPNTEYTQGSSSVRLTIIIVVVEVPQSIDQKIVFCEDRSAPFQKIPWEDQPTSTLQPTAVVPHYIAGVAMPLQ